MACFQDQDLADILVVRGATLDIDQDDPIDLEPRYFLPGPVDKMEAGLIHDEREFCHIEAENCPWPKFGPINLNRLPDADAFAHGAVKDARMLAGFCRAAAKREGDWIRNIRVPDHLVTYDQKVWTDSHGHCHALHFDCSDYYMWPKAPGSFEYHPDIPHAIATVHDSVRLRNDGILRSEMIVAIGLMKTHMRKLNNFPDHRVFPVMVMSFHSMFSARIIQAHVEKGKLVVRPSRIMNLFTATMPPDAKLAIRWLNARPIGDTRFPAVPLDPAEREEGQQGLEAGSAMQHPVSVRQ